MVGMDTDHLTTPPPTQQSEPPAASAPEKWIRPPVGREPCPYTGLRHTQFYRQFVGNRRIRQAVMSDAQSTRGTRVLWLPDVMAEMFRRAEGGPEG